jgi:acetate---CoA ligase (ADP-forming)
VTIEFDKFFAPRSVAIIGASPQRGSPRNTVLRNLQKHGFDGRIYPVSQSHAEIEGLAAYKSVAELPEAADVALIITPAATVPGLVAECGARGIRNAIVFSAGFEEVEGGKEVARRLAEAARANDVAVMGPNCQGVWSVRRHTMLTFSPGPLNTEKMLHAPIAIVSQSGALAGAIGNALLRSGIGCSYVVSVGNETCLDALDALASVIEQDDVKVAALYIEGLDDAARLLPIAQRARDRGVQIVVLKAGRSAVGQQATASHTGKIASSHAVYADVMEQAGVIAVDSLHDLIFAVEVLAFLHDPRSSGDALGGISVLSASGGAGALLADHGSDFDLPMAQFSAATEQRLEQVLPEFARRANPIDLTGQVNTDRDLFKNACEAVIAEPRTEAVVVQFSSSGRRYMQENAEVFKAMGRQGVPTVLSFIGEAIEAQVRKEYREAGVLLSLDPSAAMRALSLLYRRQRALALPRLSQRDRLPVRAAPREWGETMRFLEDSGVTPARWIVLGPQDRAATGCAGLQPPLVVKVLPSESEHKTELGLVRLRVPTLDAVDAIAQEFRQRLGKPGAGILVQEMVGDGVEVVLSCMRQTDFGPVLSIGSGGVAIELYRDIAHLALPVTAQQVQVALKKLKLHTLLQGFRGKPAADLEALALAAERFGDQFLACPDALEFEINPVIVRSRGQGLAAVDALVTGQSGSPA